MYLTAPACFFFFSLLNFMADLSALAGYLWVERLQQIEIIISKEILAGLGGERCQLWSVIRRSARMKAEVYKAALRPAVLFGLEFVGLRKRWEAELEVTEMKMQSFCLVRSRKGNIRGTARVRWLGDKVKEARRRRFGHDGGRGKIQYV